MYVLASYSHPKDSRHFGWSLTVSYSHLPWLKSMLPESQLGEAKWDREHQGVSGLSFMWTTSCETGLLALLPSQSAVALESQW